MKTNNEPPTVVEIRYVSTRTIRADTAKLAALIGEDMLDIERSIEIGTLDEWLEQHADPDIMDYANVTEECWQGRVMTATWD